MGFYFAAASAEDTSCVCACVRGCEPGSIVFFCVWSARQALSFGSFGQKALVYYARPTPLHVSRVQKDEGKYQKRNQHANDHSCAKSASVATSVAGSTVESSVAGRTVATSFAVDMSCTLCSWFFQPRPVPCVALQVTTARVAAQQRAARRVGISPCSKCVVRRQRKI